MSRMAVNVLVAVALLSCATKTTKESKEASAPLDPETQKKLAEMHDEVEVGRNMAGRLLQFYGTFDDEQVLGYVNQVGNFVAGYGDFPDRRYMFAILNSDQVNAFACPGGYILVTLGAIRNAQNEAEIAAVLGHEVAHVGKKHMFNTLKTMTPEEMDKTSKEAEKLKLPESVAVRKRPDPTSNSESGATLARYLSGAAAGLSILQAAKAGMSLILEKGLGAELEYEADREGVKYAVRAGYHPPALTDFLCRINHGMPGKENLCAKTEKADKEKAAVASKDGNAASKDEKPKTILEKTHPPVTERVKSINHLLAEIKGADIIGARGKVRFEKAIEALPAPVAKK